MGQLNLVEKEKKIIPLFKSWVCPEAFEAIKKVLESGWLGNGPVTKQFEEDFCKYVGNKYAVATNSGTEALRLALFTADLPKGTYIITTPNTFVATNHVILQAGLKPLFADIDYETGNISLESIRHLIHGTDRTVSGIMVVHYSGMPADLSSIYEEAKEHNLAVIEDCAHTMGAEYGDKKIGNDTEFSCFSFQAVKNMATGDGGMFVTNNKEIYDIAKKVSWFGIDKSTAQRTIDGKYNWDYDVPYLGFKSGMCDIIAAIGIEQLKHIDEGNLHRTKLSDRYRKNLKDCNLGLVPEYNNRKSSNHFFVIRTKRPTDKEDLMEFLRKQGIQTGYHYRPNYDYPMYKTLGFSTINFPNMERWRNTAISMPMHLYMTLEDVDYITDCVKEGIK